MGPPRTCDRTATTPSWSDRSDLLSGSAPWTGGLDDLGRIGLVGEPGAWKVLFAAPEGLIEVASIGEGVAEPIALDAPASGAVLHDLDGDGALDLLWWQRGVHVAWSLEPGDNVVADADRTDLPIADVEAIDLNGDGLAELLELVHENAEEGGAEQGSPPRLIAGLPGHEFGAPTELLPTDGAWGASFDLLPMDWDRDGDLDLYVCTDGPTEEPNRALCAEEGTLVACDARGADVALFCMGASTGDIDGDGLLDLYVGATRGYRLLLDRESGFVDASEALIGLSYTPGQMGWGSALVDLDNDGRLDVLAAHGDFAAGQPDQPLWALVQGEDGRLAEVGADLGFPAATGGRGLLAHDVNDDGVVDVILGDYSRPPWLFLSDGCTSRSWLDVAAPPGTMVTVEAEGQRIVAMASDDAGYGSTGPSVAHIGLGEAASVEVVTLLPPGGEPVVLTGPFTPNRTLRWPAD